MAPRAKRIRLDKGKKLEKLPREVLFKIIGYVPLNEQIRNSFISKWLRSATPFKPPNGCLNVLDLPFKADLIVHVENRRDWPSRYDFVDAAGITSALEFLLPKCGSALKSVSFDSADLYWEMAGSHMDLLAQHCPNLTELKLVRMCYASRNDFNAGALRQLTQLSSLSLGYFSDKLKRREETVLMVEIADLITNWPLKQLSLVGFNLWPSFSAPNLTRLSLDKCCLRDTQLAQVCHTSTQLADLTIMGCWDLTDFSSIGHLRNLADLNVTGMDDDQMESIARNCPTLIRLKMDCLFVNRTAWFRHFGQLKFLSIDYGLTDAQIGELPNINSLEELEMTNSQLTDVGLKRLSRKCPQLKRLTLESDSFTDEGIDKISARWSQLESLKISNDEITGDSLVKLGERVNLRQLNIANCDGISSADGFFLLLAKRLQLGISTPLRIAIEYDHDVFQTAMFAQLVAQLETVGVKLIEAEFLDD